MSMTIQEAIKHIAFKYKADVDCYHTAISKGFYREATGHRRDMDANEMALAALREKLERENPKPLTIADHIRSMTDEEMAEKFHDLFRKLMDGTMNDISCLFCDGEAGCITKEGNIICSPEKEKACVLRWLHKPEKDENHA